MHFQVTAIKLDGDSVVADIVSDGYDCEMRYDRDEFQEWCETWQRLDSKRYWVNYWGTLLANDTYAKNDLHQYILDSPYLLSTIRDQIRLKEIEAVIYDMDECTCQTGDFVTFIHMNKQDADHLHSLITQYGDGRVETEKLK